MTIGLEKTDYIIRTFSKIQHKQWELYIVTRIINLLNDYTIEFISQQIVRKNDGKRYLVDLFFPQFNLYLEIDEAHHFDPSNAQHDRLRQREIWDVTSFEEKRIAVFETNGFATGNESKIMRDLTDIDNDIDEFVEYIKTSKADYLSKKTFIPWDMGDRYNPQVYINQGFIDATKNVAVQKQVDALKLFGAKYKGYQRGWWDVPNTNLGVWFPRLYRSRNWTNSLSEDGTLIIEEKSDKSPIEYKPKFDVDRVVFGHYKNVLGKTVYKFVGVFRQSKEKSTENMHVHELINKKMYLT